MLLNTSCISFTYFINEKVKTVYLVLCGNFTFSNKQPGSRSINLCLDSWINSAYANRHKCARFIKLCIYVVLFYKSLSFINRTHMCTSLISALLFLAMNWSRHSPNLLFGYPDIVCTLMGMTTKATAKEKHIFTKFSHLQRKLNPFYVVFCYCFDYKKKIPSSSAPTDTAWELWAEDWQIPLYLQWINTWPVQ